MKRLIISAFMAAGLAYLLASPVHALGDNVSDQGSDIATWQVRAGSNSAVAISSTGQLNSPDGLLTQHEHWTIMTFSTTNVLRPIIATATWVQSSTSFVNGPTNLALGVLSPPNPVALTAAIWLNLGTATSTICSTMTITGVTAKGERITFSMRITTTPTVTGPAFATVSSITFSAMEASTITVMADTAFMAVGSTSTYGLAGNIENVDDVVKMKAWTVDASSFTFDLGNDTARFPNGGAASPVEAWYRNTRSAPPRPK